MKNIICILFLIISLYAVTSCNCGGELRVMTYNVHAGKGTDGEPGLERIAAVIRAAKPDIAGIQEVDSVTGRSFSVDQARELGRLTGLHAVFGGAIDHDGGRYGVALLSKRKPLRHYSVPLPGEEERRVLLVADFGDYAVFNTHLSLNASSRQESVEIISSEAAKFDKPVIMTGDFNALPGSQEMARLTEKWEMLSQEQYTFPSGDPTEPIDYIFGYGNGNLYRVSLIVVPNEPAASDHLPVYADIRIVKPQKTQ